jgi:hypothetical protein
MYHSEYAMQETFNDFVYLLAFTLGLWNTHRTFNAWDPLRKFPYRLLTTITVQLFVSLVFVLGQVLLTYFMTPVQAVSWLAFVFAHAGYCLRVYRLTDPAAAVVAAAAAHPKGSPAEVGSAPVQLSAPSHKTVKFDLQPQPKSEAARVV